MRTRMLIIGIVLLIIGIGFLASGAIGLRGSTNTIKVFNQPNPGEYASSEILLNASSTIIVRSPPTVGGLVPAQDLTLVNSTNISSYALSSSSSVSGTEAYTSITGNYYYVIFSSYSTQHKISNYQWVTWNNSCIRVANACRHSFHHYWNYSCNLGAFRKPKNQRKKDEYEYKYPAYS